MLCGVGGTMKTTPAVPKSLSARVSPIAFALAFVAAALLLALCAAPGNAQAVQTASITPQRKTPARITLAIDENQRLTLRGNVHPLARAEFDQGLVSDATPMNRMLLLLQRSPEQEAALQQLMTEQMSEDSPNFHRWLTPQEFGQQFGPADTDVQTITSWLASYGFSNVKVSRGRNVIEFSGNAGQVRNAFHTEIHKFDVNGQPRQANVSDPQIPAALAPVVRGIVTLHNFPKRTDRHVRGAFERTADGRIVPQFTGGTSSNPNEFFIVGPADFAKIYGIPSSLTGGGVTVAIIGTSDIDLNDAQSFRALFGLPANPPAVVANGPDPGKTAEEGEADLDVQLSGAVAPQATIQYVVTEDTLTASGVDLGASYVIDNNSADVISLSFGSCEAALGNAGNAFFSALWQQAAAQGITVSVAAGDPGSAGCDNFTTAKIAANGLAINGIASTPFNVALGGTDFDDAGTQANFWKQNPGANDPVTRLSALGYIKETTWNDSCAAAADSSSLATACAGTAAQNIVGGSGGPSNCASSTIMGTSITCTGGNAKPAFQNGLTPADKVRDIPDVSLFASDGQSSIPQRSTNSFYLVCQADALKPGSAPSCASSGPFSFLAVGGTSASAPAFAGIMALIDQQMGGRQGNANFVLYKMAQTPGNVCDSSLQPLTPPATCVFFDITKGNNSVPCAGKSLNCSSNTTGSNGVLVDPAKSTTPAWTTKPAYDYATGLGSLNVAGLAAQWAVAQGTFKGSATTLSPASISITHGQTANLTATVGPAATFTGTPTGDVALIAPTSVNGGVGSITLTPGSPSTASLSTTFLPGGTYQITAHYAGDAAFAPSDSNAASVNVAKENSSLQVGIIAFDPTTGAILSTNAANFAYGSPYILRFDVLNSSGLGCQPLVRGGATAGCAIDATGSVTITDSLNAGPAQPLDQGTFPLNSAGHGEDQPIQLPPGSHTVVATYSGDVSYNAATPVTLNLTVAKATTATTVAASPSSITSGMTVTLTATVNTQSNGAAPTGTVQFLNGSTPIAGTVTLTPTDGSAAGPASLKATLTTAISALMPSPPSEPEPTLPLWRLIPVLLVALTVFLVGLRFRRRRRLLNAAAVLAAFAAAGISGCGGGGTSAPRGKTVNIQAQYAGDSSYSSSSGSTSIAVQ